MSLEFSKESRSSVTLVSARSFLWSAGAALLLLGGCVTHAPPPDYIHYDTGIDVPHNSNGYVLAGEAVERLQKDPSLQLLVIGYTDSEGDSKRNKELSFRRARNIRQLVLERGIAASRVMIAARGDTDPLGSNKTEEGRARNRRVELYYWYPSQGEVQAQYGVKIDIRAE